MEQHQATRVCGECGRQADDEFGDCAAGFELQDFNGNYKRLFFRGHFLTMLDVVDSGYLVSGRRKPVTKLRHAAKQAVETKIRGLKKSLAETEGLMRDITDA